MIPFPFVKYTLKGTEFELYFYEFVKTLSIDDCIYTIYV